MQSDPPQILIVDDDRDHLEIYGLIVQSAGFIPVSSLVRIASTDFPQNAPISLVLLDYTLNSIKSTVEIAQDLKSLYPAAPILLLSDIWGLPTEIAPYIAEFVRKGDPAKLIAALRRLLSPPPSAA
jgi:DNA-binding NtrC family response regulator